MILIGIDCATRERRTGLARYDRETGQLRNLRLAHRQEPAADLVSAWIEETGDRPFLLCMDAPLGWPEAFGSALAGHAAGQALQCGEAQFFQRLTDRIVRERIGKRPLEVTANFIARTAFRALALLEEIRCTTGKEIPLFTAYRQTPGAEGGCIESYPAGWAVCYGVAPGGDRSSRRSATLEQAERRLGLTPGELEPRASEDEQDALMCCAAGLDYLDGCVTSPAELEARTAEKEGWMWLPLSQAPGRE